MKKIYSTFFFFVTGITLAQFPLEVRDQDNGNALVTNNQIFTKATTAGGSDFSKHFDVKNTSANTVTISVRKYEDLINTVVPGSDQAQAYFCFNTYCYIPSIITATTSLGAGASFLFVPKLDEASVVGQSDIRYRISANGNDFYLTIKYNGPVGVKENGGWTYKVSPVYPNPSQGETFIDIHSDRPNETVSISVFNSVGGLVGTKQVSLSKGKNMTRVTDEQIAPGIYFVKIANGEGRMTKKITISQ